MHRRNHSGNQCPSFVSGLRAAVLTAGVLAAGGRAAADLTVSVPLEYSLMVDNPMFDDVIGDNCLTIIGNLTIDPTGSINCNDLPSPPNGSACPICINVSGNMEILGGGGIFAENRLAGGNGGNISVSVGGDLMLRGGSVISSSKTAGAGDTGIAGNIALLVTGNVVSETGSRVLANANGKAGTITITGRQIDIDGLVSSRGTTTAGRGGPIDIIGVCAVNISDTGVVSSRGNDPGADRVHLEACDVVIFGLVESTGPGHQNPPATSRLIPPCRPDKPANSTAGVEVWAGNNLVINSVPPHNGEINADVGMSGGTSGRGWVDLFARNDISVIGEGTGNYAVHANMIGLTTGKGGLVTAKSIEGVVSTTGRALQAAAPGSGGRGGVVTVEAANDVAFGTASIDARGSTGGGAPAGGKISARSFDGSVLGSAPGELNASGGGTPGSVTLQACVSVNYTGTATPAALVLAPACGSAPALPPCGDPNPPCGPCVGGSYVVLPDCSPCNGQQPCVVCDGTIVVVDTNVTINFNTVPPTYTGDPDLLPFFSYVQTGPVNEWKAIFDLGPRELIIAAGATLTVSQVPPTGSNRSAPGIEIRSTCHLTVDGAIVVQSVNRPAGDILIQVNGDVDVNGTISNGVTGTNGLPGDITIASCCGDINTGPMSVIKTFGVDPGGSDIHLMTCCEGQGGDITILGLVDAFYKGGHASIIDIVSFDGSVLIDGTTLQGIEPGSGARRITSGVTLRQGAGHTPAAGDINIQAKDDITVVGNRLLAGGSQANYGAVAIKPISTNGNSGDGDINAVALQGRIIATDRAFDFDARFDGPNAINLLAKGNIDLSVTASINFGAATNAKRVVSVSGIGLGGGSSGGTNTVRSFSGGVSVGANAEVLAQGLTPGSNLFTSCTGLANAGTIDPAPVVAVLCAPAAPTPLFTGCGNFVGVNCVCPGP